MADATTLVYVANAESNDIDVFVLDPQDGGLRALQKVAIPDVGEGGSSTPMAISRDKRLLWVGIRAEPLCAVTFAIDQASGRLGHIGRGPLPDEMCYLSTDRTGRYLLAASYGGNKISVHEIGSNGVIAPAQQIVATPPKAHLILTDPSNRFALVPTLGADVLNVYGFDAMTGAISPHEPGGAKVADKAGPRHIAFHPDGRRLYLLNELDGTIVVFDFDGSTGALTAQQTVSALPPGFTGTPWAADIHLTPDGKLLYASERTTSTLAGFAVDADGRLAPVGSFETETQPRSFAIDPSGRYVLSVGQASHCLTCHAIDAASGRLSAVGRYPVGRNPNWVEIITLP